MTENQNANSYWKNSEVNALLGLIFFPNAKNYIEAEDFGFIQNKIERSFIYLCILNKIKIHLDYILMKINMNIPRINMNIEIRQMAK